MLRHDEMVFEAQASGLAKILRAAGFKVEKP
jgi:hypothetical protein